MIIVKVLCMMLVFFITFLIGNLISKKYSNRVAELKELQVSLDILENKIKFTYEPLKEIFIQTSNMLKGNIGRLFEDISSNMERYSVEESFLHSLEEINLNIEKEDKEVIKNLSKILGKTDKEGQVSQIELSKTFITSQMEKAQIEESKNSKLYKTLGATIGLAVVVVLI